MKTQATFRITRRQLASIVCFAAVFCLLFIGAERLLWDDTIYSTTWNRMQKQQRVPDILIMGNSHAYCSFVPDLLNGALGVDSAVLAVTGQDALGITDNFEATLKIGAPKLVIAELNAFYFPPGLMAKDNKGAALSNINGMPGLWQRMRAAEREFGIENIPQGAFQLLRADLVWSRWEALFEPPTVNRYETTDVLGYARMDYFATGDYRSRDISVIRDPSPDKAAEALDAGSEAQLRRFLGMAQAHGVEVWLVKSPIASREVRHPNGVDRAQAIAAEFGDTVTFCYDYNDDLPDLDLTSADFYDGGHLNRRGAARFTQRFAKTMAERLDLTLDLDAGFAYLNESITPLADGWYRYDIKVSGNDNLYRFRIVTPEGEIEAEQAWSEDSGFTCQVAPELADWVEVTVCPADLFDQVDVYGMTLRFMAANTFVLNQ